MKRKYVNRWLAVFVMLAIQSSILVNTAAAQPKWAKSASKSVFTLKTFSNDGTLLGSSTGFFVGDRGEGVSSFSPFKGAERAVIIDAQDKEWPVECMLGANETYDVAKFRVAVKKSQALPVATACNSEGGSVWLLPYREQSKIVQGVVRKAESFQDSYSYYTVAMRMPEGSVGAPLLNEAGEVTGLMQQSATAADTLNYAVDAAFALSLHTTGLSINDAVLRSTNIKKALPTDLSQAQLALYMGAQSLDSLAYLSLVNDFLVQFPQAIDGYVAQAQLACNDNRFDEADKYMKQALDKVEKKDEAHYDYSRLIYQKMIYNAGVAYEPWTLERALEEAREAYKLNAQPTYLHQQAYVLYAQKDYQQAYDIYMQLSQTNLRSADIFYEASRCQLQLGDTLRQLALLDSAVALYTRPYLREAAPYILARAHARLDANKYRDAVNDLNDYEDLMKTQVNANFYYLRFQAEVGGRLFQQALNDINQAISMQPEHDLYYAEKASLQVRVGMYDEAIETAQQCIEKRSDGSDGYLFLGLAQCLKGQKKEGLKNLQKARELGDAQADALIEKYAK